MNDLTRRPDPVISASSTSPEPEIRDFERLLAELSARFIHLPADRVDDEIRDALRKIVLLLDVDRCQLIRFAEKGEEAFVTHSWAVEGVMAVAPRPLLDSFPWALAQERAGHAVVAPRIEDLPSDAAVDKASWLKRGVRSHLGMPMRVGGKVVGALAFGCLRRARDWPEDLVDRVGLLADVFANALAHKRAQEDLERAIQFERTVTEIQSALLQAGPDEQDCVIETGLGRIARIFGAERAALWQRHDETEAGFRKSHRWLAEGVSDSPAKVAASMTPWVIGQLAAGSTVRYSSLAELPPEAAADLPGLRALGTRAGVAVPLAVADSVLGALSFGMVHQDHEWPVDLVTRVRLVGEVFAGVLARRDTERRERQAQAEATHAARVGAMGVFAASLVHELTQPLAASLANAETASELLSAAGPDAHELRATVADIVADSRRAGELVQQLRRFLRRGEVERNELEVRGLIDEVLRMVVHEAAGRNIEIAVEFEDSLPVVVGDRVQIQQVLFNLLLNGFDAIADLTGATRRIALRVFPSAEDVVFEVADSGCGMDEATLTRIFQPFFTTKSGGMGLGLSISRSIVAAHGGTLSARSTRGQGTEFRFTLPAHRKVIAQAASMPRQSRSEGKIFVIEDDVSMRRALERLLTEAGLCVEAFASAQEFLDRSPDSALACIVSDMRMPGLSGLELQEALERANRELPIVFISGHGDVTTTVQAMKAGAISFLPKPFSREELLAAVTEGLQRCRELETARERTAGLSKRFQSLTPREREVFTLVTAGLLNKVIADRLGAAEATIKIHRGRVMEKMEAHSMADLVRMAESLGISSAAPQR